MTPRQAMLRGALALGVFSLATAGSVALTRAITAERIASHQLTYQHRQLQAILPATLATTPVEELLSDTFELPSPEQLGHRDIQTGWLVERDGYRTVVLPVITRQGYNGEIRLLVGIDEQHTITGVRVTQHQETPGLGDSIERERSDWITDFNGFSLANLPTSGWAVSMEGGQFDAFTGATITPRAVIQAVHKALEYTANNRLPLKDEEAVQ